MMASAPLLVILLLWVPNVMLLNPEQLHRVTEYIKDTFTPTFRFQHAYVVKFTKDECKGLSTEDIKKALNGEDKAKLISSVAPKGGIYEGPRMVAASFNVGHSEYRLLSNYEGVSPVEDLLNKAPQAGCVIFYSLYSPCLDSCVSQTSDFSIFYYLDVFDKISKNDRAFVFRTMFNKDCNKRERDINYCWNKLNSHIPLYRCNHGCTQCYAKPNQLNKACLDSSFSTGHDDPQPSGSKRRLPDEPQPSTDKKRKPDSPQPSSSDRRKPDSPQPSSSDRRKSDSPQPSSSDRRKSDSPKPSSSGRRW